MVLRLDDGHTRVDGGTVDVDSLGGDPSLLELSLAFRQLGGGEVCGWIGIDNLVADNVVDIVVSLSIDTSH